MSCNDRDKGAEVTFTLQSLGGSGGPTFQHHCVSFSGGPRIFLLLSPLFHDGHIFSIIVFITTIVYSDISDQNLQEWCERYKADLVLQENLSPSIIWFLAIMMMMIIMMIVMPDVHDDIIYQAMAIGHGYFIMAMTMINWWSWLTVVKFVERGIY